MDEMPDDNKLGLLKTQAQLIHNATKKCTAPIFLRNENRELRNGTITSIKKDNQIFCLTACHVVDECIKSFESDPDRTCQIGNATFDPSDLLIARHTTYDLATFKLSEPYAASAGLFPTTLPSWPPKAPAKDELVILGGYPGAYRFDRNGEIDFGFATFIGKLDSVSDQKMGMVLRIESSLSSGQNRIPSKADLGGWSGGPVFRIIESPIFYIEVIGIIYEYSQNFEIVFAHSLTFLDGIINEKSE